MNLHLSSENIGADAKKFTSAPVTGFGMEFSAAAEQIAAAALAQAVGADESGAEVAG